MSGIHPEWEQYAKDREAFLKTTRRHKLVYLAGPYSSHPDKEALMKIIMHFSGSYMMTNRTHHVVSPLFNHYSLGLVPQMGTDYAFWGDYSRNLLPRCDEMIVLKLPGWDKSTGVDDEIRLATELGIRITYIDIE